MTAKIHHKIPSEREEYRKKRQYIWGKNTTRKYQTFFFCGNEHAGEAESFFYAGEEKKKKRKRNEISDLQI